ncbi:hypothetical protein CEUSTIGMA_g7002.t1 [Chlamydomonas eustigma]|uniref:Uncharacterized protein n=1 Tax=Chlamydomonas eustigma TaxID=1157962 RepID=A0A250X911_9CHLO|nr:hypothetical protein CEUSTIGMA_g7002.t1 [Chlamydomonas eustigma]|eukprot:GAX79561.1 hypothetical protein CEUSTIGMA_g7002.t1 [Chlamydomonas eustigma]
MVFNGYDSSSAQQVGYKLVSFTIWGQQLTSGAFGVTKLVFPVAQFAAQTIIKNMQLNSSKPLSTSFSIFSPTHITVSTSRFGPIYPSDAYEGVKLSFEIPSGLALLDFFQAPLFAAFPANDTLCPVGLIGNSILMATRPGRKR